MKILSWNINGYRNAVAKGHFEALLTLGADVLCFQETKHQVGPMDEMLMAPAGYQTIWHPARRSGYAGVAIFSRLPFINEPIRGVGDLRIDAEGRVLRVDYKDFSLINAYFPHSHRELTRLDFKLSFFVAFERYLDEISTFGRELIICGDFNIAHTEKDLTNFTVNRLNAGFRPEERAFMDRLIARGFVDAFREFQKDGGHYTWWSNIKGVRERNVGWRLDYFFISQNLTSRLVSCEHLPNVGGSDHCPVILELASI